MLISVGRIDPQASDSGRDPGGAKFRVDRNLDLVSVKPLQGEQVGSSYEGWQASWRQHWRPIIQDGKYVNEAAGWND